MIIMKHTNYYVPLCMTSRTLCFRVVRPSVCSSVCPSHFRGTTLRAAPSKNYAFSTNYHVCIAMPTWRTCAPPILFWPWPSYILLKVVFNLDFLRRFSLIGTTLCAAPSKSYTPYKLLCLHCNMPTWDRCASPILFWPWSPYSLLLGRV